MKTRNATATNGRQEETGNLLQKSWRRMAIRRKLKAKARGGLATAATPCQFLRRALRDDDFARFGRFRLGQRQGQNALLHPGADF